MVTVTVSETYDLSTKVGKMGLVGIHTPTGSLIDKMWPGLVLQYKKFRFVQCDVAMACASMLPADPLQIGVEAGAIAPQDMFNPILYKAVSNESMNNFLAFLQGQATAIAGGDTVLDQGSVVDINDTDFKSGDSSLDQFRMYYGLLADPQGWRKAMPQAGLEMRGLYPLVYSVVSPYGQQMGRTDWNDPNDNPGGITNSTGPWVDVSGANGDVTAPGAKVGTVNNIIAASVTYRGPSMRMPALDTTVFNGQTKTANIVPSANGAPVQSIVGHISPAYVGLIVLPPAKLNQLYYRLKVQWTIEFTGLRSMADIGAWDTVDAIGGMAYGTDYGAQSTSMASITNMADASEGATIEKVMEGR